MPLASKFKNAAFNALKRFSTAFTRNKDQLENEDLKMLQGIYEEKGLRSFYDLKKITSPDDIMNLPIRFYVLQKSGEIYDLIDTLVKKHHPELLQTNMNAELHNKIQNYLDNYTDFHGDAENLERLQQVFACFKDSALPSIQEFKAMIKNSEDYDLPVQILTWKEDGYLNAILHELQNMDDYNDFAEQQKRFDGLHRG